MVDFEKALLKTKVEKLESELNYTKTERDNLFAQANDDQRYIRQCESTIKELEKALEAARQQNGLFMYRLTDIIEEARHTQDTNPTMLEIMAIATGKNDAEMIEKGVV